MVCVCVCFADIEEIYLSHNW